MPWNRADFQSISHQKHRQKSAILAVGRHCLTHHPNVEAKLIKEFEAIDDAQENYDAYLSLERSPYFGAVIKEVRRLYPSAAFSRRPNCKEGLRLGSVDVPSGGEDYFVPYLIHRDTRYWRDPDAFHPERWLDPKYLTDAHGKTPEQQGIYFPFSDGMRNCVGRMLALVELRTALKQLLQEFKFVPSKQAHGTCQVPQVVAYLTLCPNRVLMDAIPRHRRPEQTSDES